MNISDILIPIFTMLFTIIILGIVGRLMPKKNIKCDIIDTEKNAKNDKSKLMQSVAQWIMIFTVPIIFIIRILSQDSINIPSGWGPMNQLYYLNDWMKIIIIVITFMAFFVSAIVDKESRPKGSNLNIKLYLTWAVIWIIVLLITFWEIEL